MSIDFNGVDESVDLSGPDASDSIPVARNVSAYTMAFWIQRESDTGDSQQIFYLQCQQGNSNSRIEVQFQFSASLVMRCFARAPDSTGGPSADSATIIGVATLAAPNTHVVVVVDPGNDLIDFYVNGVLDQSNSVSFTNSAFDDVDADEFFLGTGGGTTQSLDGKLDDLRGFARRLTADEIAHLYNCRGHDGMLSDFRWRMDDREAGATVVSTDLRESAGTNYFTNGSAYSVNNTPTFEPTNLAFRRRIGA